MRTGPALLTLALALALAESAKINTPRVLVPWLGAGGPRLNFTFEISEGGCYSWSLSRDDVITLEPLYEDSWGHCSRAARVSPHPNCSPPGSVIILAEDVITGEIIRGDVDIDKISSLKIVSTTWKLYLEEAPEAFEVEAFDDQGNKFSSLEGVDFTWRVENAEDKMDEEPVVKLVWWRDTGYEAPRSVSELESQGRRSYSVLLYGQTMGEATVVACLNSTCADVTLRVVASVVLTPATAIIAPSDTMKYRVVRARAGRLTVEDVADTLYRLSVLEDGIATLYDGVSTVRGKAVGSTTVSLMSGSTEVATSTLSVSAPHSIRVVLRPASLLVRGEPFLIQAVVMDMHGRALTAGKEILVRLTVEGSAGVNLLKSTENGTLTDAVPAHTGDFTVLAILHSVAGKTLYNKVEGQAEASVVEPLEIVPPELFIAWTDSPIEAQLQHRGGGDGPVVWSTPGDEQASGEVVVNAGGVVLARSAGGAAVRVQLASHPHVRASGRVWVVGPEYLRVASSGYARVGRPHLLHVALTGTHPATGELFTFHRCDCNVFAVTLLEGPEPHNVTATPWIEPLEGACCVLSGIWSERGSCALRVSRGNVGDTARVFVQAAPKLVWPQAAAMLLGSTLPVLAAGEALTAKSTDPGVSDVKLRSGRAPHAYPDLQLFTIACRRKGETTFNLQSSTEDEFEDEGAELPVACASAASRIRLETTAVANCSGGARLWLRAGGEARLKVALLDAVGRELLDEAGHRLTWEMSPSHPALEYRSPDRLMVETHPEYEPVPVPIGYYQVVRAGEGSAGWSGALKATSGDVSATIHARVVAPLAAEPQYVDLAYEGSTPSNIATVSGGSGRYTVDTQKGATAKIENGQLTAVWASPGRYELLVVDSCLVNELVNVDVRVEEVITVEISSPRAVCVGACVSLSAVARGASGRVLRSSSAPTWRVAGGAELRGQELCGVTEGGARVRAAVAGVWSADLEVIVFPPLRVVPERVRVPPGARLQLAHVGGPPRHLATLTYEATHAGNTVEVSNSGLVVGSRIGTARVRLTARDGGGAEMVHAEAEIEVVGITGVRALAATRTLLVGEEAPLWLEADPSLTPAVLAALQPAPRVIWSLRDPTTASLSTPLLALQSSEKAIAEGLSVRLTPLRAGPITVDVRVRMHLAQGGDLRTWETSLEVLSVQELKASVEGLKSEEINTQRIAVAVGSTIQLRSSPRALWRALVSEEAAFEVSLGGEVKALRSGFGVALGRYRDDRNNYERETVVHIEVSTPHYVTAQLAGPEDDLAIRLEAHSVLGTRLLAPNMTLAAEALRNQRVSFQRRTINRLAGSELLINGLDTNGTFVVVQGTLGAAVLRDYAWIEGTDVTARRIGAGAGWAVCLEGGGWRGPPGVWLGERGGVTLALLSNEGAGRHVLKADRPPRSVTIAQSPISKLEFAAGEWPAVLVPLSLDTPGLSSGPVLCSEEQRTSLADLQPPLPYACTAEPPYKASAAFDTFTGQMGCSVRSDAPLTDAAVVEVCAEWSGLHTCTQVALLPPVRLTPAKLTLTEQHARLTVHGHPFALKSVTASGSPGLTVTTKKKSEGELTVDVSGMSNECGSGWVTVRSRLTAQELRVVVEKNCEATCGSLLGAAYSLLRPHFTTLATVILLVATAVYLYARLSVKFTSGGVRLTTPAMGSVIPAAGDSSPMHQRTWSRSPYAVRRGPSSPVYGDTSVLPDSSFSPTSTRNNSRFL